jgi:hypothetical protein
MSKKCLYNSDDFIINIDTNENTWKTQILKHVSNILTSVELSARQVTHWYLEKN